jgi:hypothetical protein
MLSKETYMLSKETYMLSKETYMLSKETTPVHGRKTNRHHAAPETQPPTETYYRGKRDLLYADF